MPTAPFAEGRIARSTGRNRFRCEYTLAGEALGVGPLATTSMAPAEWKMVEPD
jgi:heat shock protein HslJ